MSDRGGPFIENSQFHWRSAAFFVDSSSELESFLELFYECSERFSNFDVAGAGLSGQRLGLHLHFLVPKAMLSSTMPKDPLPANYIKKIHKIQIKTQENWAGDNEDETRGCCLGSFLFGKLAVSQREAFAVQCESQKLETLKRARCAHLRFSA